MDRVFFAIIGIGTIGLLAATVPAGALAQPMQRAQPTVADVVFTEIEKRLIREYYTTRSPAGLHGKGRDRLPPGMQKRLSQGKPLPPGIAKRNLPVDLESRLPIRSGVIRQVIGNDIVLIAAATNIVLDILIDAVKR